MACRSVMERNVSFGCVLNLWNKRLEVTLAPPLSDGERRTAPPFEVITSRIHEQFVSRISLRTRGLFEELERYSRDRFCKKAEQTLDRLPFLNIGRASCRVGGAI